MATLVLDTQLCVENVPINYTDILAPEVRVGRTIVAKTKVPVNLLFSDATTTSASALINLELNDINSDANSVENIKNIIINDAKLLGLANALQASLEGELNCNDYTLLGYLPLVEGARPVDGFGKAVVRILQHIFMKFIMTTAATDAAAVNNALNNVISQSSSTISNILMSNENDIVEMIHNHDFSGSTTASGYATSLRNASGVSSSDSSANIVSRLLQSLVAGSQASTGVVLTSVVLKHALQAFLSSSFATKLHDLTSTANGAATVLHPVMFEVNDKIVFTIDVTKATLIGDVSAASLPTQTNLNNLFNMGVTRIFWELSVGASAV